MRSIILSQSQVALVDDSDYEWLNQWKWYAHKECNTWYALRDCGGRKKKVRIKMHRLIMGVTDSKILVDHKDRNGLNNSRSNLRFATRSENNRNSVKRHRQNITSQYKGVQYRAGLKRPWKAFINVNKKMIYLGYYETEKEAALVFNNKAVELYKEFACLNDVNGRN